MSEKLLEIKDLFVEFTIYDDVIEAVNGVSLSVDYGETVGLVGETGAGKTTTALALFGLVPHPPGRVVSGEIIYKGRDVTKLSEKELRGIRGSEISMIFQDPMTSLNPVLTIGEQIVEVISLHSDQGREEIERRSIEMLELVGIHAGRFHDYPHQFSGGMKQRVMIAMALACNPSLLVADEPTTALDVTIQAQILELMGKLKKELNTAILMITHDLGVVCETCDKVAIMYAGEIMEFGSLDDIFNDMRHPYTVGLFKSIPDIEIDTDRLEIIPGMMPDPSDLPGGCKFHPRCTQRGDRCDRKHPPMTEISPGHFIRCNRYDEGGESK